MWEDYSNELSKLSQSNRLRALQPFQIQGVHLVDEQGNRMINFGSNDYLGLSAELRRFACLPESVGATASGLVCGWTDRHQLLADRLAEFESTESAILFPSGYAACSGTVATLAREGDLLLSDQLNHASLIDGCRLSRSECQVYRHRDVDDVASILGRSRHHYQRAWIVTNTVFSMDGHVAPIDALCDIAERYDASLIVDEAHATGVVGDSGSGVCEAMNLRDRVHVRIGTLSKAMGGQGGFVAGPKPVMEYLVNRCRSLIFSTAMALPAVEAAISALELIRQQPQRRQRLKVHCDSIRQALEIPAEGIEASIPIIPIIIGADGQTVSAAAKLRSMGMFVPAIRPPTVPEQTARLRVSLSAGHENGMIKRLIDGLRTL